MGDFDGDSAPQVKKNRGLNFGSLANKDTLQKIKDIDDEAGALTHGESGVVFDRSLPSEEQMAKVEGVAKPTLQLLDQPNINVSTETLQLDDISNPQKDQMNAEFDRRKRARQLTLPTDDNEVKRLLRKLSVAICLFGEDRPDRRERAHCRLIRLRELRDQPTQIKAGRLQETHKWVRTLNVYGSQVADNRPIGFTEFSPHSKHIATASWSGLCKVWSVPSLENERTLRGHNTRCMCIRWNPRVGIDAQPGDLHLASSGEDGMINLWDGLSEQPISQITGHELRVSRLAFHPSARFLATCCHDNSWRLFDLEADQEVLHQEGHSKPVFDIDFQKDGSLAVTGGMDAYGRVWDLRTGRCIMFMEGHQRDIHSVVFAPNGFNMASGSADNTIKMWDLRMRRCRYTIPAHLSLISRLKFCGTNGNFLLSGSYDNTIKVWIHPGWQQIQSLETGNKVMCVDLSPDAQWIASASYDRTLKLWTKDDAMLSIDMHL